MKIILTGSLGHIGRHLVTDLAPRHQVTVITTTRTHVAAIEALGAKAAVGQIQDQAFMTQTLTGADAAFLMLAGNEADAAVMTHAQGAKQAQLFAKVISQAKVKRVVNLSSIGADLGPDVPGFYRYHQIEAALDQTAAQVSHIRPAYMYNDFFELFTEIRRTHRIAANFSADERQVFVAPEDVAPIIITALTQPTPHVQYVASDEVTGTQAIALLGAALNMPDLTWQTLSDGDFLARLVANGVAPDLAAQQVQMWALHRQGRLYRDYDRHHPQLQPTKFPHFATNFAKYYFNEKLI